MSTWEPSRKKRRGIAVATPVGACIGPLAAPLLEHPRGKAQRLWQVWRQVVGEGIARHTEPVTLEDGILVVRVDSSAWVTQLNFMREPLLEALAARLPEELRATGLRFRQGSLRTLLPELRERKRSRFPPATAEERQRAIALTAEVKDETLRESLRRLLEKSMVRNRLDRDDARKEGR